MTPWRRVLLGACVGAMLTLIFHPVSRPFLFFSAHTRHVEAIKSLLTRKYESLKQPKTLQDYGLWMLVAAQKYESGASLRMGERQTIIALAREANRLEPQNAYWQQMEAVFLRESKQKLTARAAWMRAAKCSEWNDYQTEILENLRQEIESVTGSRQAWLNSLLYYNRSDAAVSAIQRLARAIVREADIRTPDGLAARYSTLRNGSLIETFGKSFRILGIGANLVELATYPPDMVATKSPKRLWIAQTEMLTALQSNNVAPNAAAVAIKTFRDTESWRFLAKKGNPDEEARSNAMIVSAISTGPSGALAGLIIASFLIGLCALMSRRILPHEFNPIWVGLVSLAAGGLVWWISDAWIAALSVALSIQFINVCPENPRSHPDDDLGPFFRFMCFAVAVGILVSLVAYAIGVSTGFRMLSPYLDGLGGELSDRSAFIGLFSVVLGLPCLIGPTWGVVHKIETPEALLNTYTRVAKSLAVTCLVLCLVGTPIAVMIDYKYESQLAKVVQNEPVYYYVQH